MSDLQIVLIALGALIIAGVVGYNWLQERKLHQNISGEFIAPQRDVLTENFYIDADAFINKEFEGDPNQTKIAQQLKKKEPMFNAPALDLAPEINAEADLDAEMSRQPVAETQAKAIQSQPEVTLSNFIEHPRNETLVTPLARPGMPLASTETTALPADLHPQIDLTAILFTTNPLSAERLIAVTSNIASEMGVPLMLHGLDTDHKWYSIETNAPKRLYKQIACSIQLADRSGSVSKLKLNKFQFLVENIGLELSAHVEWQGVGDALLRATDLDQFCMEVDQIVSVHLLQSDTPIHGTKFKGLAEANNLKLQADGKFYLYPNDGDGEAPLFSVTSVDKQPFTAEGLRKNVVKGAVFQIEIPKVAQCEQVFNQMFLIAQQMATSLNTKVVDDYQKPLSDLQLEKIRQQLKVIHAKMLARGVMPGTAYSLRLFS